MRIRSTRLRSLLALSFLTAVGGFLPRIVNAETRTAAAVTPEAVWDAIDAAKDGDTVQLPEGKAVWKHGWNTGHWAKMKAITIQGAGIDKTIICDDTSTAAGDEPFDVKGVEGKPFRITGITFDGTGLPNAGTWAGEIVISGNCKNFRVDHCRFLNMDRMMTIHGDTYGLVDHCSFDALQKKGGLAQTIYCLGPGKANFTKPLTLGTAAAVYFEDNEADFSPAVVNETGNNPWIVPYDGARVVIRHNKIINSQLEIYRVRPGALGCQSAEIYDNAFSAEGAKMGRPQGFIFISGGVAIVFNNTVTGTTYNCRTIEISHERSFQPIGEFGICDGKNPIDGNQIPAGRNGAGYPCMGQPGRATDADGDGVFEPSPCYAWNNTLNGAKLNMTLRRWDPQQTELQAAHVKEGRDFFNQEPKPDYYKPYAYPHPLQGGLEALRKSAEGPANAGSAGSPTPAPTGGPAGGEPAGKPRLAATPPMGWNSWEAFRKDLAEDALKAQADAMVRLGLRDAGYVYFVIDGGWKASERDAAGGLVADPKKFPHGMRAFADYLHERGLKFGLHQPAGVKDCGHDEPGSQGNEERDAALFASWGVDFIKYDQCDYVHDPGTTPGAPDLDKVVVRKGGAEIFASEAEAPQNRMTGMVRVEDCPSCSGGKCVAGIGYGKGGVEIPDARAPEAGRYTLEVAFAYPYYGQNHDHFKQMTLFVSVNGGQRQRVDIPYAIGKRYTTGAVSIDVELKQGENAILLDNPSSQEEDVRLSYVKMASALQRSGRPIVFSTSGAPRPWLWADPIAHLWRTSGDINDQWAASVLTTLDRQVETLRYAGPGFWADPDMLEVGNKPRPAPRGKPRPPMTPTEQRSQFSLWAIMNAPLFISTDLRHADEETKTVLLNREVIAINQDPLGVAGRRIRNEGAVQVFARRLKDGEAVALLNRGDAVTDVRVTAAELGLDQPDQTNPAARELEVRDLWAAESSRVTDGVIKAEVEPHGVKLLRVRRGNP